MDFLNIVAYWGIVISASTLSGFWVFKWYCLRQMGINHWYKLRLDCYDHGTKWVAHSHDRDGRVATGTASTPDFAIIKLYFELTKKSK